MILCLYMYTIAFYFCFLLVHDVRPELRGPRWSPWPPTVVLTAVRSQAQHPGFTMKLLVVFLGLVGVLAMSDGAVMDLLNLVRRYEDEILGRRVGYPGIRSNNNLEDMEEEKDNVGM